MNPARSRQMLADDQLRPQRNNDSFFRRFVAARAKFLWCSRDCRVSGDRQGI
jgi:hypothetical protein